MPAPRPVHSPPPPPVVLELPNGDRYHLHPRPADLEGYLAPDHVPHLEPGIAPIRVRVTQAETGYTVALAPDEVQEATLVQHPPVPARPPDPDRGRGQRDPDARRLGPNADHSPDPGHRGTRRRRRKPLQ